ncbi:uncharacterized protein B0P05DRAFT_555518 [Gilbertella persicaria]|uniref:uncharacterized protein n=1 Tax=Gilbertella persicaria TaxID=101096 RepID=UPI00221EED26|nr:uncharacterized protein B0P05DRAFT_555518 [Gilbertella persicaria]KAI8063338.1 hypothetical protein B0P05DRAFT_555518 [Gilbertella persicaria]
MIAFLVHFLLCLEHFPLFFFFFFLLDYILSYHELECPLVFVIAESKQRLILSELCKYILNACFFSFTNRCSIYRWF